MEEELLTASTPKRYYEIFDELFPFYLNMGMSPSEYWDGDSSLPRYYRKSYELKKDEEDYKAWLQGAYMYDAFSVVLYNMFGRSKGKKPMEYLKQPYREQIKENKKKEEKAVAEAQAESWMRAFVSSFGGNE